MDYSPWGHKELDMTEQARERDIFGLAAQHVGS